MATTTRETPNHQQIRVTHTAIYKDLTEQSKTLHCQKQTHCEIAPTSNQESQDLRNKPQTRKSFRRITPEKQLYLQIHDNKIVNSQEITTTKLQQQ
jgi:hypothetical protein